LAAHVTCVWVREVLPGSLPYRQRTVPNGSVDIVCALGSPVRVVGPQTGPREYDVAPGSVVVGVRLRPAAAAVVLGLPAVELVDQECSAGALWRGSAGALDEALADTTPRGAAGRLEQEVARRLADAPALDPIAVRAARCLAGARSAQVALLARRLHVSERQLRRRVEAATGLTPKALHRVVRRARQLVRDDPIVGSVRVYANFADPTPRDPKRAYYAENLPRLRQITNTYDPDRLLDARAAASDTPQGARTHGRQTHETASGRRCTPSCVPWPTTWHCCRLISGPRRRCATGGTSTMSSPTWSATPRRPGS
jgi:AraC-like DNA-binding protein